MPYPELWDDDRVFDAASSASAVAADMNELQDQLRYVLKAQQMDITSLLVPDSAGAWAYNYTGAAALDYYWSSNGAAGDLMKVTLPLRQGQKLTVIDITYKGESGHTGGEIALYKKQLPAVGGSAALTAASKLFNLGQNATNPWEPTSNPSYYWRVRTTVNTVIEEDFEYFIVFSNNTAGGGKTDYVINVVLVAQMGN